MAMTTTEPTEARNLGVCNLCGVDCYYEDMPGGGHWIHEWPNKAFEKAAKSNGLKHDADPGWTPVIPERDVI